MKANRCQFIFSALNKTDTDFPLIAEVAMNHIEDSINDDNGKNMPTLWVGLGIVIVSILIVAILFDAGLKAKRANEEVALKIEEAKEAANRKDWKKSLDLLQNALSIRRATNLNEVHGLMREINEASANETVAGKVKVARLEFSQQRLENAILVLREATTVENATNIGVIVDPGNWTIG